MQYYVFDIESDGLLGKMTKIHVLSYRMYEDITEIKRGSLTDYDSMKNFLEEGVILVGHNIVRFDIPALEKILKVKVKNQLIDTLGLSWYLYPYGKSFKHALGAWGERLGFGKPVVEDWENQPLPVYINRCEADVEINSRLFHKEMNYLFGLYGKEYFPITDYITFKLSCLREQEETGITLDVRSCETEKHNLEFIIEEKIGILSKMMPKVISKEAPKVMYKKDGTLSAHGKKWLLKLEEHGLPETDLVITEPGNPGSSSQLKDWLLSEGWVPQTFTVSKATGKKIPQVSLPHGQGICPSVQALYLKNPNIKQLEGLFVAKHRYGLFKSFLSAEEKTGNGKVVASASGFTKTLRLAHSKPVVNLPGVDKYYGDKVRGVLTVPDDSYTMIGSDVSGLEDRTKMHWMYYFDPEYVKQMQTPGFDGHLAIAVFAGMMSKDEEKFYKRVTKEKEDVEAKGEEYSWAVGDKGLYKHLSAIRKKAKPVGFGGQYGIGAEKLAEQLKIPVEEAKRLLDAYWELNHAVKKVAKSTKTKVVNDQVWQYNPVSKFWYFLSDDKDRFSSLNQSAGAFLVDVWIKYMRRAGVKIVMQYHDEILTVVKNEDVAETSRLIKKAMEDTNKELKLNVKVGISVEKGLNYASVH